MPARLPAAGRFGLVSSTIAPSLRRTGRVGVIPVLRAVVALSNRAPERAAAMTADQTALGGYGGDPTDVAKQAIDGPSASALSRSPQAVKRLSNAGAGWLVRPGPGGSVVSSLQGIGLVLVVIGATGMARHRN